MYRTPLIALERAPGGSPAPPALINVGVPDRVQEEAVHLDGTSIVDVAERAISRLMQAQSVEFRDQTHAYGDVAVLVPCRNEEGTIAKVVRDFRRAIPAATVYVYDNDSTDGTAAVAAGAGAIVRRSPGGGKGSALRRMFAEVDAAVYVLADGDDTYDASAAPNLIDRLHRCRLDMVVGKRVDAGDTADIYRRGHRAGNRFLSATVQRLFGGQSFGGEPIDMLSGYRVFSRRYVKSFAAFASGFAIETEMTIHALDLGLPCEEVPTAYQERPSGSQSKLRTIPDGLKILWFLLLLFKDYRPLRFFGCVALGSSAGAVALGVLAQASLHSWTPAAFMATTLGLVAVVSAISGVILDSLRRGRREMERMLYLAIAPASHFDCDRQAWSDASDHR